MLKMLELITIVAIATLSLFNLFWVERLRDVQIRALDSVALAHRRISRLELRVKRLEREPKGFAPQKTIEAVVTAYTAYAESTGKQPGHPAFNITASGYRGAPGVCAADARYYPFGTAIYIHGLGPCVVLDTGGAIKGPNRFDYYVGGTQEDAVRKAIEIGRRTYRVDILSIPK